jgi:OFA family oxalate/formate antiporter-like MFS transporter
MDRQGVEVGSVLEYGRAPVRNLGWRVTLAGIGINLALGVLYSWSVIKKAIPVEWQWSDFDKTLPYSVACLVFAIVMVPAGRAQDRFGPRWVALAGGISVGVGLILASFTSTVMGFVVGFGIFAGAGFGMGYAAATPAAVKWFPAQRTGMIAGLVVAGFGLASVYIAPLGEYLINHFAVNGNKGPGVQATLLILGIAFLVVVAILSQLLAVPPAGWKPAVPASAAKKAAKPSVDFTWQQMLGTPQFYLMWIMYAFGAGAGLMIIASLAKIVELQAKIKAGFMFVAVLAIGNAAGRIVAGMLSDRIGRRNTMLIVFVFQAGLMFVLAQAGQVWAFVVISLLLGANYGANLALFPAATKDYFGLKNFGVNYGWVFTAWGVGGLVFSQVSGRIYDSAMAANKAALITEGMAADLAAKTAVGNYHTAYLIAGVCLIAAALLSLVIRPVVAKSTEPALVATVS